MELLKVYIGDGIYASYDGMEVILTTENGIEATNTIIIDNDEALIKLTTFLETIQKHK